MRVSLLFIASACCLLGSCASPASHQKRPSAATARGTGQPLSAVDGSSAPAGSDAPGGTAKSWATIESVHAELDPVNPSRAKVMISGLLHDGSTRVQSIDQRRSSQGVAIIITTARQPHSGAGVALIPFERTVSVDLTGVKPGALRITANEASTLLMVP